MKISITVKLLASDGKALIGEGGITLDNPTTQEAVAEATRTTERLCEAMNAIQATSETILDSRP
jgi:hypothetical protein